MYSRTLAILIKRGGVLVDVAMSVDLSGFVEHGCNVFGWIGQEYGVY